MKELSVYFIEAAKLLYKEPKLYLAYLFFLLLTMPFGPMENSPLAWILGIIGFIGIYLGIVYGLSAPAFYAEMQTKKPLTLKFMSKTLKKDSKRFIWPFISCVLLFILFLFLFGIITAMIHNGNPDQISNSIANFFGSFDQPFSWVYLIISILLAPFLFTNVLFSIEKERFWQAAKKSINLSFKFPQFLLSMLIVSYLASSLINFIPNEPIALSFLKQSLDYLVYLWLVGASFTFYQKNLAQKPIPYTPKKK